MMYDDVYMFVSMAKINSVVIIIYENGKNLYFISSIFDKKVLFVFCLSLYSYILCCTQSFFVLSHFSSNIYYLFYKLFSPSY